MINSIKKLIKKTIIKHSDLDDWRCYSKSFYEELALKRILYLISNAFWSFVIWIVALSILLTISYYVLHRLLIQIKGTNILFLAEKISIYGLSFKTAYALVVTIILVFIILYFQVFRTTLTTKISQKRKPISADSIRFFRQKPWYQKMLKYWLVIVESLICFSLIKLLIEARQTEFIFPAMVMSIVLVASIRVFNRLSLFNYVFFSFVVLSLVFSLPLMLNRGQAFTEYFSCFRSLLGISCIIMFVIWTIVVFIIVPIEIIRMRKFTTDLQHKIIYFFTYWKYFLGSIALKDIATVSGIIWFFIFSLCSTTILSGVTDYNSLDFWGYIAAYFASIALAFSPLFNSLVDINGLFTSIFNRFITKSVLNKLHNHLVLVGLNDLGRSTIRSVFNKMHGGKKISRGVKQRGFSIIINENLDIGIVSHNIVVIDKDERLFFICNGAPPDYSIGLFTPFENLMIFIVGICGDINHPAVAQISNLHLASILFHTLSDHQATLSLSKQKMPAKKILATMDTPSYDAIVAQGYGKPIFAINTTFIEGISIAQKIIQYFMKELRESILEHLYDPKALMHVKPVLLIGQGKIIYYIIHSIRLSLEAQISDKKLVKKLLESKFLVFSKDSWFEEEIVKTDESSESGFYRWEFYPIRREYTDQEIDCISLLFYKHTTDNYENFINIFTLLLRNVLFPGLCVFLNNHEHDSTIMINRAINALISLKNDIQSNSKTILPHIISSCHHSDRRFVSAQLMRYLLKQEIIYPLAYPLMNPLDSLLNRDLVSGNQMGTLVDALYNTDSEKKQKQFVKNKDKEDLVAELSYCLDDDAGAFMKLLASLHNWRLEIQTDRMVPSFSFCYTFNDRHFANSFIFTGTAYLQILNKNHDCIHGWSINSDHYMGQKFCAGVIKNTNQFLHASSQSSNRICNRRLTDCIMSTYSMHSYCEDNGKSDYWRFTKDKATSDDSQRQHPLKIGEKVHFKLWSQSNNIPGSLAKSMIDISLCNCYLKDGESPIVPYIEFTTSIPCGYDNRAMSNLYVRYFRTSGHSKYAEQYRNIINNTNAPIQSVKIKLSNPVNSSYDEWITYAKMLTTHLNRTYRDETQKYTLLFTCYRINNHILYCHIYDNHREYLTSAHFRGKYSYSPERAVVIERLQKVERLTNASELIVVKESILHSDYSRTNTSFVKLVCL